MTLLDARAPSTPAAASARPADRRLDATRLRGPVLAWSLAAAAVAALGATAGTVVAGLLAERPTAGLVWLLAACVVGAAVLDTAGRAAFAGTVDRAEGQLRADLLAAALHQPLSVLSEQAVGEVLDRVDDDTHELGNLVRRNVWDLVRTLLRAVPMWVVAGLAWAPAWVLFPLAGVGTVLVARPLTAEIARRKVLEEVAWTDHAAAVEEGVAARDDLRSSLGQAYVVRRCAELSAAVHRRVLDSCVTASTIARRVGLLLHGLLALTAVAGALLVDADRLSTAELVTLFLVTTTFVGQLDQIARHLPELQAGLGALARLRALLAAEPEPVGGRAVPPGSSTCTSTGCASPTPRALSCCRSTGCTCRPDGRSRSSAVPARGSRRWRRWSRGPSTRRPARCCLGGVDVLELDLQALRSAVGVVTQRTEVLAATLAENVALHADVPRAQVEEALRSLGLEDWVAGLPDGLDTVLGPGGTTLSAGEEQLVAFARLLVRDVQLVVLDEATARMDPLTEARVVRASERLLRGRTGLLVAHRLATTERADLVAVLDGGRVVQSGPRAVLAAQDGPFRALLTASGPAADAGDAGSTSVGAVRRTGEPRAPQEVGSGPSLARRVVLMLRAHPRLGRGRRGSVPAVLAGRRLRRAHRAAVGAHRRVAAGRRATADRAGPAGAEPAGRAGAAGVRVPRLPAVVGRRAAPRPARGPARPDHAAPAAPHPRRRGRRARARRRPLRPLRRPVGRPHQRPGRRRGHGRRRAEPARGRGARRGHARLGRRIRRGVPGSRPVRRRGVDRPRRLRPLAGVSAGVGAHGEARRRDPGRAPPPAARGRRPGRGGRRASTACRPSSTACPSCSCSAASWPAGWCCCSAAGTCRRRCS